MNVLVVGDKDHERKPVAQAVKDLGHTVAEASDGKQAWALYKLHHYDVVVSDYLMPELTGLQLCDKVRRSPHPNYTYFIVVSSRQEEETILKGFHSGVDDYLAKPVRPLELECRLISAERVTRIHRELAQSNAQLLHLSNELKTESRRDALTGVGNRLKFADDLKRFLDAKRRYGHRYFLGLCDIDNFKKYNDTYGHVEGDKVLRKVADTLVAKSRGSDYCYRFGGEEFLMVFADQDGSGAKVAAKRLVESIAGLNISHEKNDPYLTVTLSIGLSDFLAQTPEEVDLCLRKADEALYVSKNSGRNRLTIWDPEKSQVASA